MAAAKFFPPVFTWLILLSCILIFLYSTLFPHYTPSPTNPQHRLIPFSPPCNLFKGQWVTHPNRKPMYNETCPFHRKAWNCLKNRRVHMDRINSLRWVHDECDLPPNRSIAISGLMRYKRIGFVGDSLNENFMVSFLCVRVADLGAKKWKRKGVWRGAYFPKFNVIVAYHRSVLLAKYK